MNITNEEYHSEREHVSKSWLDKIAKCPAYLKHYLDNGGSEPTPAMAFGSLLHTMILEPELLHSEYFHDGSLSCIDKRTKAGKEQYAAFLEACEGRKIVSISDWKKAEAMRDSVMSHRIASRLLTGGKAEQTVFFNDDGCKCKARADYLRENCIVDLKTTVDASPAGFAKSIANYRYNVQQAHYCKGFNLNRFVFVAVEKTPPYLVGVYVIDEVAENAGINLRKRDIEIYQDCLENNFWPGYSNTVEEINLPGWAT